MTKLQENQQTLIWKIVAYLIEESFSINHLNALMLIVTFFNHSEEAENEIFIFAAELYSKYNERSK